MAPTDARPGYAPVDGLSMYYELHGRPLILLHGAYKRVVASASFTSYGMYAALAH